MRNVELERVGCAICGDEKGFPAESLDWKGATLRYVLCPGCGLKYLSERPTGAWYAEFYRDEFWQSSRIRVRDVAFEPAIAPSPMQWEEGPPAREEAAPDPEPIERRISRQRRRARKIWRIVGDRVPLTAKSRVLEVGAGFGETLDLLRAKTGCSGMAVEPSAVAAARIRDVHGLPVVAETVEQLPEAGVPEASVDLAISSHVLENTLDPVGTLRILRRTLAPEGRLYVDTCNLYYNNAVNPYHPFIFSPETLAAVLGLAGFRIEYSEHAPHPGQVRRLRGGAGVNDLKRAPYLSVIAAQAPERSESSPVDPEALLAAQQKGAQLLRQARRWRSVRRRIRKLWGR